MSDDAVTQPLGLEPIVTCCRCCRWIDLVAMALATKGSASACTASHNDNTSSSSYDLPHVNSKFKGTPLSPNDFHTAVLIYNGTPRTCTLR